jgi:HEAT repeat protein
MQIDEAIATLGDRHEWSPDRVQAARFLATHHDPRGIDVLVRAAEDNDPGVRYAAAKALASYGEMGLPPLLHSLLNHTDIPALRETMLYVIKHNRSDWIRQKTRRLQQELHGPAADLIAILGAGELLVELVKHKAA